MPPADTPADAPDGAPGSKRGLRLVAVLAGILLLGGVGFFVQRALRGGGGGAGSPEEAVEQLIAAIEAKDPVAVAAMIDPDEVRGLGEVIRVAEKRFSDAKVDTSPGAFAGLSIEVDRLRLRSRELGGDFASVELLDGRVRWRVEPAEMSDLLRDTDVRRDSDTFTVGDLVVSGHGDHADDSGGYYEIDPHLITVRRDGGWYVSILHTGASYLVEANGLPDADYRSDPPADRRPSETPEAAVVDLIEGFERLDPEVTLDSLPVREWNVLWHYRDAIERQVDREGVSDFRVRVHDHETDVSDLGGGRRKVSISRAEGEVAYVDDRGDRITESWWLDGWCLRWDREDEEGGCWDDADRSLLLDADDPYVVVVAEDGGWVVSPMATLVSHLDDAVGGLTTELIHAFIGPERVAPSEGDLVVGQPTEVTTNSAGYGRWDLTVERDQVVMPIFPSSGHDHRIEIFDDDGDRVDEFHPDRSVSELSPGRDTTYRVVIWSPEPDETTIVEFADVPVEDLDGATARGRVDTDRPVVDFRFTVAESGTWTWSGDDGDVSVQLYEADRMTWIDCHAACFLEAGDLHHLRVRRYGGSNEDFEIEITPRGSGTVDGGPSVSGSLPDGGERTHLVEVPDGMTALLVLDGTGDDFDLLCNELWECESSMSYSSYESIILHGPQSGRVTVDSWSGSGTYTLSIEEYDDW